MQKIKLFIDAHIFDGIHQGTVTYLSGLYSELIKDARFQLYVGSQDIKLAKEFLGSSNFIHIKYKSNSKLKRLLFSIPKALKENKIDYAHFQYISPLQKPCKYIVTIHDLLFLEFPENFPLSYRIKNGILFYLSTKRADLVTTVSTYSKDSINRFFKIPLFRIEITPNAVEQSKVELLPIKQLQDKKFILFVSRIEPRKNQALLIKLWKELDLYNRNIDLVLVGSEGLKDTQFQQQLNELSEKENAHFHWLSKISISNLNWLYKNCELFVFPSCAEGFGIPPLEAAVHGAKVLCSNLTAMSEFNFFEGFMFNPNDYDEFKHKIIFALNNDSNRENIVSEINKKYCWTKIAKDFGDLIFADSEKEYDI